MTRTAVRACGSCTACCKTHEIVELEKPRGEWCRHCEIKKGCGIYEIRPDSCREFVCDWLTGFGKEEDRPDRTRVVLDYINLPNGLPGGTLQIFEVSEGALKRPFVTFTTGLVLNAGIWVSHIPLRGQRKIFLPRGQTLEEEFLEQLTADKFEVVVT